MLCLVNRLLQMSKLDRDRDNASNYKRTPEFVSIELT